MIEQPMPKTQLDDIAWVTQQSPLPIFADESLQRLSCAGPERCISWHQYQLYEMFPGADHLEIDDHRGFAARQVPSAGSYFTDFGYNGYLCRLLQSNHMTM